MRAAPLEAYSIDELALLTDDAAVRRKFDFANALWVGVLAVFCVIASFVELIYSGIEEKTLGPWYMPLALVNIIFTMLAVTVCQQLQRAERLRKANLRAPARLVLPSFPTWIVAFFAIELAVRLIFVRNNSEGVGVWMGLVPWLMIGVRLAFPHRLALHTLLASEVALKVIMTGKSTPAIFGSIVAAVVINSICLAIGAMVSKNLRRSTIVEWSARAEDARERLRIRDELQVARELQLSMLPACAPSLAWADIAATSLPASEVGGDYYDYFGVGDCLALVCGDVAGHGLASGLTLAAIRGGFTLLRESLGDPAHVLSRLHQMIRETSRRRMLVTACVLLLDPEKRRAVIASAGHPPILVRRNATQSTEEIELFAAPLGVHLPQTIPQRALAFESGDVFVLHTDGIYESRNAAFESYGIDRLADALQRCEATSAAEIRDAIVADVAKFRAGNAQDDDVTIVVVRVA